MPDAAAEWERVGYHVLRELESINRKLDAHEAQFQAITEMRAMLTEAERRDAKRAEEFVYFRDRIEQLEKRVEFVERRLYVAVVIGTGIIGVVQFLSSSGILQHFLGISK